uniref:Uncharacterized protein n=1 Tax=Oryza sativa subsp. japonica TaxID=39947 RepID=Q6H438_ORYSJ|nr:hypothetical protein [Oryza sativa Japonica Group]
MIDIKQVSKLRASHNTPCMTPACSYERSHGARVEGGERLLDLLCVHDNLTTEEEDGVLQLLEPLLEGGPKSDWALQSHVLILERGAEVVSREVLHMIDLVRGRRTVLRGAHPYRLAKLLGPKDDVDVGCPGQVVLAMQGQFCELLVRDS